jgi:hypothetical protein
MWLKLLDWSHVLDYADAKSKKSLSRLNYYKLICNELLKINESICLNTKVSVSSPVYRLVSELKEQITETLLFQVAKRCFSSKRVGVTHPAKTNLL